MERRRYRIFAKRRDTTEEWTDWAEADTYEKAEGHARYCEGVGYAAMVQADDAIVEIWHILGGKNDEKNGDGQVNGAVDTLGTLIPLGRRFFARSFDLRGLLRKFDLFGSEWIEFHFWLLLAWLQSYF